MQFVLYEDEFRENFLPLTYTRPVYELRIGVDTLKEKWENFLGSNLLLSCEKYLVPVYGIPPKTGDDFIFINGRFIPELMLVKKIKSLNRGQCLISNHKEPIAFRINNLNINELFSSSLNKKIISKLKLKEIPSISSPDNELMGLYNCPDIFRLNGLIITKDFQRLTHKRKSAKIIDPHTVIYNPKQVFLEEGATVKAAILNAEKGPIYLGKNSVVEEGAIIKGPFALGEKAHVLMGAKIRGDSTIGPGCKVGGEISNSVFFANSNKAHDGFIGNSVVGEWCNLGAGTTISNLKNNYSTIKRWDIAKNKFMDSGLQFCGLIMGDHSKSGIQTMFNTGTVAGVGANIFGAGFPPKFIPSFAWGGPGGFETFQFNKMIELAGKVMERRNVELKIGNIELLMHVFEMTKWERGWVY